MSITRRVASLIALTAAFTIPVSSTSAVGAQTTETACGTAPAGYTVIESDQRFIFGTTGPDFICAGDSNNIIRAMGKDDIIYAGGGNDLVWGGFGNDQIWSGDGDDVVRAGSGVDSVSAGDGNDQVFGGDGIDTVLGGVGDDELTGGNGHDVLQGGDGNDLIVGNRGFDEIVGGAGNDTAQGGQGNDSLLGGNGDDVLSGGDHDDTLGAGNGNDRLLGGNGNDSLTGGNGNDALIGGGNPDQLRGSAGDDIIDGGNGLNFAIGGSGADECKNVDHPATNCDIVDGLDQSALPSRIWLVVPGPDSPGSVIAGTAWTPTDEIDITLVDSAGEVVVPRQTFLSDAAGNWEVVVATEALTDATILIEDSTAGRRKSLTPILDGFDWNQATRDLEIPGPTGETMEAHISFPDDELIFVEQMTFGDDGTAAANFSEVDDIGQFEIRRNDDDGDVEIHGNITGLRSTAIDAPVATVTEG